MQVSTSQLKSWYKEFTDIVFDGDMPNVSFLLTNNRKQLGQAMRKGTPYGNVYTIKVSNFYEFPIEQFRNTLLHEMCHIWCYYHGYRDEHHTGYHWKCIADKAYRLTGLKITRTIDLGGAKPAERNEARMEAVKARKNAPAIIVDMDYGTYHFLVKCSKNVLWAGTNYAGELSHKTKVYITDDKHFLNWQSSRSLHRGYKYSNSEFNTTIKPKLEKGFLVENIRNLCIYGEYDCLGVR